MAKIEQIDAYQVFDSRGQPTVEAIVRTDAGTLGRGIAPSGASTGQFEAHELRDGDPAHFRGKSVHRALENIRGEIARALRGHDVADQAGIDAALIALDGTSDKSRLGANATVAVSMAVAYAAAATAGVPLYEHLGGRDATLLPVPQIQIIGGGAHANHAIDVQDFMIVTLGARSFEQALEMTYGVYQATGDLLRARGLYAGLADEGGYWPLLGGHEAIFELLLEAVQKAGYQPGHDVAFALDIAASDFYQDGQYRLESENRTLSTAGMIELMTSWCQQYPIISLEDPLADTDPDGWQALAAELRGKVQLVGDDLFTTSTARIAVGVERQLASAVLIKLNQVGTLTETLTAIRATQQAGWGAIVSARSGETEDAFIAHLALATGAGQLKVGSFARSERMVKWNEVLRIAHALGPRAKFDPQQVFPFASRS